MSLKNLTTELPPKPKATRKPKTKVSELSELSSILSQVDFFEFDTASPIEAVDSINVIDAVLNASNEPSLPDKFIYLTNNKLRRSNLNGHVRHVKCKLPNLSFRYLMEQGKALGVTWDEYLRALISCDIDNPTIDLISCYIPSV
jgi:hypothetical protein